MKNAMKRIMSLMLAIMLLISVVPAAFAAEGDVKLVVKIGDSVVERLCEIRGESAPVRDLLTYRYDTDWASKYTFSNAWLKDTGDNSLTLDSTVSRGQEVHVRLTAKDQPKPETKPEVKPEVKPITVVVKVNNSGNTVATKSKAPADGVSSTVENLLTYVWETNWDNLYKFDHAWYDGKIVGKDAAIPAGGEVHILVSDKVASNPTPTPDPDPAVKPIHVVVKVESSNNIVKEFDHTPANKVNAVVENLLTYGWSKDWDNVYTYDHAYSEALKRNVSKRESVEAGDTLYIMLTKNAPDTNTDNNNPTTNGTYYNGGYTDIVNKTPYEVYLNIYLNGNVDTIHKIVKITTTAAKDGKVTLGEVQEIVKDKYNAKDSDGIQYDGLYLATGNWMGKFANDTDKYNTIDGLDTERKHHVVNINVMIKNATAKSSGTADSSNPKTGDTIMIAVTTMALAGAALVAAYELKKRKMI